MSLFNKIFLSVLFVYLSQLCSANTLNGFNATLSLLDGNANPVSGGGGPGTNSLSAMYALYVSNIQAWSEKFLIAGRVLLGMIILLDFSWLVIQFTMQGASVMNQLQELLGRLLFYGMNLILLNYGGEFIYEIFSAFDQIAGVTQGANSVGGVMDINAMLISVVSIISVGIISTIVATVMPFMSPVIFEFVTGMTFMATTTIMGMVGALFLLYVEVLFIIAIAPLIFALGGSSVTSQTSLELIKYSIGLGFKMIAMAMIAGLAQSAFDSTDWSELNSILTSMIAVIVCASLFMVLPDRMATLTTGGFFGFGSVTLGSVLKGFRKKWRSGDRFTKNRRKSMEKTRARRAKAREQAEQEIENEAQGRQVLKVGNTYKMKSQAVRQRAREIRRSNNRERWRAKRDGEPETDDKGKVVSGGDSRGYATARLIEMQQRERF